MIPKKLAPDLIRGGNRFSERIMLKQEASVLDQKFVALSQWPSFECRNAR